MHYEEYYYEEYYCTSYQSTSIYLFMLVTPLTLTQSEKDRFNVTIMQYNTYIYTVYI